MLGDGVGGLLNFSQIGAGGSSRRKITGAFPTGQQRYFRQRITHQYLTIHIKDVIISVAMITKRLLVTRTAKMAL